MSWIQRRFNWTPDANKWIKNNIPMIYMYAIIYQSPDLFLKEAPRWNWEYFTRMIALMPC